MSDLDKVEWELVEDEDDIEPVDTESIDDDINHLIDPEELYSDLYIQGEILGPRIQGNKYGFTELQFRLFNVKNIKDNRYFDLDELKIFSEETGIPLVPLLETCQFDWRSIDELLEYSKGQSTLNSPIRPLREGIVIRPTISQNPIGKMANMMSFKVINPDFDLKYGR